jgi:hypothetical protein
LPTDNPAARAAASTSDARRQVNARIVSEAIGYPDARPYRNACVGKGVNDLLACGIHHTQGAWDGTSEAHASPVA